jgi:glutaredoxin 3
VTDIVVYTKSRCPHCTMAKALLTRKKAAFREIDVERDPLLLAEMLSRSNGRRTVPQIFIDGVHVGGSDDPHDLTPAAS